LERSCRIKITVAKTLRSYENWEVFAAVKFEVFYSRFLSEPKEL